MDLAAVRARVPGYEELQRAAAAVLRVTLPAEARVLVAGAGTGAELEALACAGPRWRFTAAEPSAAMAWEADRRLRRLGLTDRVSLQVAAVEALTPSPTHHAGASLLVSHFLPDDGRRQRYFEAMAAQLAPGAALVLAELAPPPADPVAAAILRDAWLDRAASAGLFLPELVQMTRRLSAAFHPLPRERLSALLMPLGFSEPTPFFQVYEVVGYLCYR